MSKVTIKTAAALLETSEQGARELIKRGKIPGACCWGSKKHLTYYITEEQIRNFKREVEKWEERTETVGA